MIQFGIVGAGNIAQRFMTGINHSEQASVVALYARDRAKGESFGDKHQIDTVYDDYKAMLSDERIQAVYIALPNFMHYDAIMEALLAGKHVLCEKPSFIHEEDCVKAFALAKSKKLMLMEAMKVCFLPTTLQVKRWIERGNIGKVKSATANFCRSTYIPQNHPIYDVNKGGGAMFDVGCYGLAFFNHLFGQPTSFYSAMSELTCGVDETATLTLKYDSNILATLYASFGVSMANDAVIYGEYGKIRIHEFWKSQRAELVTQNGNVDFFEVDQPSEFVYQIDHFCDCILRGASESVIMSEVATMGNLKIILECVGRK